MTQNTRHVCCVCVCFPYLTSFCACCIFHGVSIISTHQNQCNSSFCGPLDAVHKDPMVCNSADPKVAGTSSYGHAACFQIRSAPSRVIKHLTCGQSIGFYFNIHMSVIRTWKGAYKQKPIGRERKSGLLSTPEIQGGEGGTVESGKNCKFTTPLTILVGWSDLKIILWEFRWTGVRTWVGSMPLPCVPVLAATNLLDDVRTSREVLTKPAENQDAVKCADQKHVVHVHMVGI